MSKSLIITCICGVFFPSISYATLGEAVISIQQDNRVLAPLVSQVTTQNNSNNPNFITSIIKTKTGTIKEFSAHNKVFAVTWTGRSYPNFQQIFGSYFNQLDGKFKQTNNDMNNFNLVGNDFVMQMSGSANFISGIAYIPSLLPLNTNTSDLK